jgi:hypothetical protein
LVFKNSQFGLRSYFQVSGEGISEDSFEEDSDDSVLDQDYVPNNCFRMVAALIRRDRGRTLTKTAKLLPQKIHKINVVIIAKRPRRVGAHLQKMKKTRH